MKILIRRDVLLDGLEQVSGPTLTKQNSPILESILIEANSNQVKLTTTDLNTTIIKTINAEVEKTGKTLVLFKQLISITKELPPSKITIELLKNNLLIRCENIELKINTLNISEFPKIEQPKNISLIKINPQDLNYIIKLTSFCVGHEDTNYVLGGVLFEIIGDSIIGVATDGKRLSMVKRKLPPEQAELTTKISFILPARTVNEIQKILKDKEDEICFFTEENNVGFDLTDLKIITRPIEGEFPDYNQFIPQPHTNKLVINKNKILPSLKRAALFSTLDYQSITLELKKNSLIIHKTTPHLGEVKEELECKYTGKCFSIGFNPHYLIDVLRNIEEPEVSFEFFDADKAAVLRKEDYVYLALPMKI